MSRVPELPADPARIELACLIATLGNGTINAVLTDKFDFNVAEEARQNLAVDILRGVHGDGIIMPTGEINESHLIIQAYQEAFDFVRHQAAGVRAEAKAPIVPHVTLYESTPLDELSSTFDLQRTVQQALGQLNPDTRLAIELNYMDGYTYDQIAEQLDTPRGTISARIRRGKIQLEKLLRDSPTLDLDY
jgi:RNA polymerase sigma factor (sigma-70 family)